jgi:hypothetical protein
MPDATDTLDLAAKDVSDGSWEDLVESMMEDELDAMAMAGCRLICSPTIGSSSCNCGCSSACGYTGC